LSTAGDALKLVALLLVGAAGSQLGSQSATCPAQSSNFFLILSNFLSSNLVLFVQGVCVQGHLGYPPPHHSTLKKKEKRIGLPPTHQTLIPS
jgi:hypothetical protein